MNADEMEAGRELDALVAEKVMGKDLRIYDCPHTSPFVFCVCPYLPRYSTYIAAAWKMEEMIEQRGFNLQYTQALMSVLLFEGFAPECDEELWWALIHASPFQRCRAALKAIQNER